MFLTRAFEARFHNKVIKPHMSCCTLMTHVEGGVPHTVDRYDPVLFLKGTLKRNLGYITAVSRPWLRRFRDFVRRVVRQLFTPLRRLLSFEEWLAKSNYSGPRKEELRRTNLQYQNRWKRLDMIMRKFLSGTEVKDKDFLKVMQVNSFDKAEFYDDIKYPRTINSRSDAYKCRVGPAVHSMEEVVYQLKWFIKHIPVSDRPDYISTHLPRNAKFKYSIDFSSFEESFPTSLQMSCERWLYCWLLKDFPSELDWVLAQASDFRSKGCGVSVSGQCCRMSGEMTTSLGNGFTNLMLHLFNMDCQGLDWREYCGIIEGDDSLSATQHKPDTEIWARLGFVTKIQYEPLLNEASFCGNVYVEGQNRSIGDPRYYCATAGWSFKNFGSSERVRRMLTFAKGASFVSQFAGSPIIAELGARLIRESGVTNKDFDRWFSKTTMFDVYERNRLQKRRDTEVPVTSEARALCCRKFNVPVETQLILEHILRHGSGPIDSEAFLVLFPPSWRKNYASTVETSDVERLPVLNRRIVAKYSCNLVSIE